MRSRPFASLLTVVSLSFAGYVHAQDPLDEMYGHAVHSYFRGDSDNAKQLLTEVIDAGSLDPRAFFFRGLCQPYGGVDATNPDFERAAQLEIEDKKVDKDKIGKALERIQGPLRVAIEKARSKSRLASRSRLLEMQRARYEEMQRGGGGESVKEGLVVPPKVDPAPSPFATNDPFSEGMTKGKPKAMDKEPDAFDPDATVTPPADDKTDPMPAADDDPFK